MKYGYIAHLQEAVIPSEGIFIAREDGRGECFSDSLGQCIEIEIEVTEIEG